MGLNETLSPAWRLTTNVISLLSVLFFSGIIFGWAPLELLLLEDGQYAELCPRDAAADAPASSACAARTNRLHAMFTLAQFALSFASLPVGCLLDVASKPVYFATAGLLEVTGLALFATSESGGGGDHFLLGYVLLAAGGCMTMLGAFPASFLLAKYQAGILASIACLFDGSSIVFYAFYKLHRNYGYTRRQLFAGWAGVAAAMYTALVVCWTHLERSEWRRVIEREEDGDTTSAASNEEAEGLHGAKDGEDTLPRRGDPHLRRSHQRGLQSLGVAQQLRTWEYALAALFASCQMVRCNFFIMTVDDYLTSLGDDDAAYANAFGWILPCGIAFVPLIERTVASWGVLRALHFTNALGLAFGLLLWVPSLGVQAANFGVFACFRAYLYAILNTFIALTFGAATMGRMIGFVFTTAAVVTLAQYPLSVWTSVDHNGDFMPANVVLVLLCLLPIVATVWYERASNGDNNTTAEDGTSNKEKTYYGSTAVGSPETRSCLLDRGAAVVLASPGSPSLDEIRQQRL